jgi:hypothetical protein
MSAPCTAGQVVVESINRATCDGGQIETLRDQLNRLIDVVEAMANLLPDDKVDEFVERISCGYERVGGVK